MLRRLATILQKAPWLVAIARNVWRLTQPKFSAGVVGVVLNADKQVLLVEHVFHPYAPWGLPGGWIDRHETPAEGVARELKEELELIVQVGPVLLAEIDLENHIDLAYLCTTSGTIGRLSSELLAYGWYDVDQLPRLHRFHYRAIQTALQLKDSDVKEESVP